ncbi:MAG: hypothetical protein Q3M30_12090 [Candidatus Electrothrix sp. Rat3]|nr:hypothetical protein [Candidatus Electrothrix rattekaaiensis]
MLKKKIMRGAVAALLLAMASPSPLIAETTGGTAGGDVGNGVIAGGSTTEEGILQEKAGSWTSSGLVSENPSGIGPLEGFTSINAMTDGN